MLVHTTDGMALRIGQDTTTQDYIGFLIEKILSCHRYHRFGNTVASNQQRFLLSVDLHHDLHHCMIPVKTACRLGLDVILMVD